MTTSIKFQIRIVVLSVLIFSYQAIAQKQDATAPNLDETILALDAQFWKAYNTCDIARFDSFFTNDIEFYHDKGGLTATSAQLVQSLSENVCGNENERLRREVVEGTVNVYPLNNFGAIISGDHLFYLKEPNAKERLVERAKFTSVWKFENEQWKMSRVLSYDHQPVSDNIFKEEMVLSKVELSRYIGNYEAPQNGPVKIHFSKEGKLIMNVNSGRMVAELYPEKSNVFFIKEAPLVIEFVENEKSEIIKFIVKENGKAVEEAKKVK